jgi:hypothetical protein
VFHLKRNPNCNTWTPSCTKRRNQWQYWIFAAVSRCCSWCAAWNMYGRSFSCFISRWALVTNTSCVPKCCYQSVYCCLIRYFLVRIRIAKCFTNSSKRIRCEVMFENEHTFGSWITPCSYLHSFCATGVSSGLATRATLIQVSRGRFGESITRGWTCFWFYFCIAVLDCYWVAF